MKPFRVAVAGLSACGDRYLNLLMQSQRFDVCAVADADGARCRRLDACERVRLFEDYRSLVLEMSRAGLDILIVALEPFQTRDLLPLAAQQGIAVFHKAPFARTVREGRQVVDCFSEHGVPFGVAREWRHCGLPLPSHDLNGRLGYIYSVLADIEVAGEPLGWRGDAGRAGGGVLLHGAYEAVDWLIAVMGVPETVYAVSGFAQPQGKRHSYDTEDHIAVLLRWRGDRSATLTVRRTSGDNQRRLTVTGTDDALVHTGIAADRRDVASCDLEWLNQVGSTVTTEQGRAAAQDQLSVLAVIEAAYLSARNGAAEAPSRFTS